jgi:hypothetical protein
VSCFILVTYIGSVGAIISLIAGELIILLFYVYLFKKISAENDFMSVENSVPVF